MKGCVMHGTFQPITQPYYTKLHNPGPYFLLCLLLTLHSRKRYRDRLRDFMRDFFKARNLTCLLA